MKAERVTELLLATRDRDLSERHDRQRHGAGHLMDGWSGDTTITIVEKLVNPHFQNTFSKAALGLPYEVNFCLHRGPSFAMCNLTFDFDDGSALTKIQRAGEGQNGCDKQTVTYNDKISRTITVTAETILETDSASITVDVIDGFQDSDIDARVQGVVNFGSPSVFEIEFTGGTVPEANSVQIYIDYGDGTTADSGPHSFAIASTGQTKTIQHVYAYDSTFTAQVQVFSDCCRVVQNVTVGVYKAITNLQAELYYLADIPAGQKKNGLEDNSLLYPTNKPLHFNMTNQDNAFAETYDVTVNAGGAVIITCQKLTSEFSILLNDSGPHTIDVTATNPSSSDSISTKSITMYELIEGFSVAEANSKVAPFEQKLLDISFDKVGTETCVYVDYGDGTKYIYSDNLVKCTESAYAAVAPSNRLALTGLTQLSHAYSAEQYYQMTVLAKNDHSSFTETLGFSITGLDCSKPTVSIPEG
ncbi:location of vulva defective 1 [Elysia marginata]|uniref:Location of vulva defective 1 n=1 Tax=Elysia marginata TaxID=1093978 RepID=A0AAV4EYV9_9GAST|nr:location of vulva defective 1 [Elysia marginata]